MTNNQLKLIYKYMVDCGWCFEVVPTELDSNSVWEVVQEMERRGEHSEFEWFVARMTEGEQIGLLYLMNPTNFFNCFAKWLEEK